VQWDHPILDTVLLSAVLFGASVPHTLDALCDRLDITIPTALRHTALGDAQATAEALVKMIPMLQALGFGTLGEVIAQTRRHGRLLEDLNPVDNHGGTWQAGSKT
jgi:DNA polymerase-3 subunit epsilon